MASVVLVAKGSEIVELRGRPREKS
jgi:hypothetical protein